MKAMILAAGRGTRLKPHTNTQPKALVKVAETPLLALVIRRLIDVGCKDIIINVHHFGAQIIKFIEKNNSFGINISISDERDELLNTGGALKKAAPFFEDGQPFLLCNTDILCDLDLLGFYQQHRSSNAIASLAVQWRPTSRYLIFDEAMTLYGWRNQKDGSVKMMRGENENLQMLAFSGIHIISPKLFKYFPEENVFSIIDVYLNAAKSENIKGVRHDGGLWIDVGRSSSLDEAEKVVHLLFPNS